MKYTVYGIVFESKYIFSYFRLCSDLTPVDLQVEVVINPNIDIPSVKKTGKDWFEISQPDAVIYKYYNKKLHILAKDDNCIKSTISTVPFFMAAAQKGGVLLHAACVVSCSKKAAIITAPSGTGKSTIAAYLAANHNDVFQIISDDAIAVYFYDGIPYVHTGPTFSKIDYAAASLVKTNISEKNHLYQNKFFMNHHVTDAQKFMVGAIFFMVSVPASDELQIQELDRRAFPAFIRTSIVGTQYTLPDTAGVLFDRAMSIGNNAGMYIMKYPHRREILNNMLSEDIYEKCR